MNSSRINEEILKMYFVVCCFQIKNTICSRENGMHIASIIASHNPLVWSLYTVDLYQKSMLVLIFISDVERQLKCPSSSWMHPWRGKGLKWAPSSAPSPGGSQPPPSPRGVAKERTARLGDIVGYQIRLENKQVIFL